MGAPGALGYALVALGPGAAFWAIFIAPKSFVSLLAVFSSFFWLSVMLATAAAMRLAGAPARLLVPFLPTSSSSSSSPASAYAPVLIAAVAAEELARAFVAAPMHERAVRELQSLAVARGEALSALDRVFLAFAWGFGHAACHALFLYAYALPLAAGPGTLYAPQCPQMSAFMTGALAALGGGCALAAAAVVGLEAWSLGGGADCSSSSALADAPHRASDAGAAGEQEAAAPPPQTRRNLAARLRACPGSFLHTLTAFLRSRRAWLSSPGWPMRVLFPPCLHLALALATLAALYPGGGCAASSAAVLALGVGAVVLAARRAIRLVAEEDGGGVRGGGRWAGEEGEERRRVVASPRAMQTMGGAAVANGGGGAGGGVRHRSGGGGSSGGGTGLR